MNTPHTLTESQTAQLRTVLQLAARQLAPQTHGDLEREDDGSVSLPHFQGTTDDDAVVDSLNEAALERLLRDEDALERTLSALDRMHNGTFGACSDCGEPVGAERLMALPTALRCVACQTQAERTGPGAAAAPALFQGRN